MNPWKGLKKLAAAYVSEIAPAKKRGEYMGYFQVTFSIGFMLGPWLGTEIYEQLGAFNLWIIMLGIGMISVLCMLFIKERKGFPPKAGTIKS